MSACYYKRTWYITSSLFDCRLFANLSISYFLLATILFASSLGLPNPHPNLAPVPHEILHHNVERQAIGCDPGWTLTETYCRSLRKLGYVCTQIVGDPPYFVERKIYLCPEYTTCLGDGLKDAMNPGQSRSASCVPEVKRILTWAVKKLGNSIAQQCRSFKFASTSLGIGTDDSSSGMMAVQVTHDLKVTYPPMPTLAELYYDGASNPIQSITQQQMEMEYGSFAFTNTFDATQPLRFCVVIPTGMHLDWTFIPYSSSDQGVSYRRRNVTHDKANFGKVTHSGVTYDVVSE